jgi:hypothetical protein
MTTRTGSIGRLRRAFVLLALFILIGACGTSTSTSPATVSLPPDDPSITPVPPGPTATPPEPIEFVPPSPTCPAPPDPVTLPDVTVSVDGGAAIIASRGSSTFMTCTTGTATDVVPIEPPASIAAHAGDVLRISLPPGWGFLQWEGFDGPVVGEGGNVWTGTETPDRPVRIDVPVPARPGDSLASYSIWMVSADDRVVGRLDIQVRVRIDP